MKFNRFVDITHSPLRLYNRAAMLSNIMEDHGLLAAQEYLDSFPVPERKLIIQMIQAVKERGTKHMIAVVTEGVTFTDEPFVQEAA